MDENQPDELKSRSVKVDGRAFQKRTVKRVNWPNQCPIHPKERPWLFSLTLDFSSPFIAPPTLNEVHTVQARDGNLFCWFFLYRHCHISSLQLTCLWNLLEISISTIFQCWDLLCVILHRLINRFALVFRNRFLSLRIEAFQAFN